MREHFTRIKADAATTVQEIEDVLIQSEKQGIDPTFDDYRHLYNIVSRLIQNMNINLLALETAYFAPYNEVEREEDH